MRRIRIKNAISIRERKHERGVALITTLLLLMLLTAMAVAMVWSTRSDMLISGNYRNFRGSFYAADSGLNIVREAMMNQFVPQAQGGSLPNPAGFVAGTQPIPAGTEGLVAAAIANAYGKGTYTPLTGSGTGNASGSWPERFTVTAFTLSAPACTWTATPPNVGGGACGVPPNFAAKFTYTYNYSITVQGQSRGTENTVLSDNGQLSIESDTSAQNIVKNFAAYGMFIDQYSLCSGGTLVPGTITGPTFTNGSWNFGNGGKYTFTDPVGQAGADAGYQSGSCIGVAGPSGNGISPTFQKGFNLSQPQVPLPKNSYNQERAVLDGVGTNGNPVTNADLNSVMRDVNRNPYPAGGTNNGVFLPYTSTTVNGKTVNTFKGGGIFVQGDASVVLAPAATCSSSSCAQTYKITQSGVTTTVTVDSAANQTTIQQGNGTPTVITGVPDQFDPMSGSLVGPDTMLYVNGNVTSLSGPGQGQAAIQNATALTVTAADNVTITGDILYKQEPVYLSGSNIDQLTGNDTGQCLGIFTATGNIDMHNSQSNGMLEIDASLATISQGGSGALINSGAAINTLTIVGGRIQNTIQNINTTTRNVLFDRRFASGFAPPWFPSTSLAANGVNNSPFQTPKVSRLSWQNQTIY